MAECANGRETGAEEALVAFLGQQWKAQVGDRASANPNPVPKAEGQRRGRAARHGPASGEGAGVAAGRASEL